MANQNLLSGGRELLSPVIPIHHPEGIRRLNRSSNLEKFFKLANHFRSQPDRVSCAATSAAIVMNALRFETDRAPLMPSQCREKSIRGYRIDDFLSPEAYATKPGHTLDELKDILETTQVSAKKFSGNHLETLRASLREAGSYVIANYLRSSIGQEGNGHFSPIGAHDLLTDSFLIMDVNPAESPWIWVAADTLRRALNALDDSQPRGFLVIRD